MSPSIFDITTWPWTVSTFLRNAILAYAVVKMVKLTWTSTFARSSLQNIPGPPPQSWLKGNLGQLFNPKGLGFHQGLVDTYGGMVKVYGFFGDKQLYISDPRALQHIILKEQDAFEETSVFLETNKVIFGPGLVATKGEQHRRQRKLTAPIFATSQLRQIVPTFYEIAEKLTGILSRDIREKDIGGGGHGKTLDMSNWMSRVALESVGRAVLGYSFDPLDSPHDNSYTSAIKELIPTIFKLSLVRQIAPFLVSLGPPWLRRKAVELIPHEAVQKLRGMSDVMHEKAREILHLKRQELVHNPDFGDETYQGGLKDIISALVKANNATPEHEKLSENELTGQMTVLIFGAQDTTSSALSRILWLLSLRPDIQEKVRAEIINFQQQPSVNQSDGRLGFDDVLSLPWLDAVVKETLRLYPPVPFVRRVATKDSTVPYMQGEQLSHVSIPAGTILFVSIAGSNRCKSVWGESADEWKPERWLGGATESPITKERLPGIYSGMMSFLGGQRSCIGYRFAQLEMKIILSTLLTRFRFSATKDEIVWNLSQIIAPSIRMSKMLGDKSVVEEKKGLPLFVEELLS